MSSKSKRQLAVAHSTDQTNKTQQLDANTNTMVLDFEELSKKLPPDKLLTEGRQYVVRKTKRIGEYWIHFINYFENDLLRCEYNTL